MPMKHARTASLGQLLFKYRIVVMAAAIVILGFTGIFSVQARQKNTSQAQAVTPHQPATSRQITRQQRHVKKQLHTYLKHVTADGNTSVSFYNLGAVSGSHSAQSAVAKQFYQRGKLATSANAHTPEVSASTYKLFIAAYLFHLTQQHAYTWTTTNQDGFHRMIVNSANDFPESILDTYGLDGINAYLASEGLYSPTFVAGNEATTTATSLRKILVKLARAEAPFNNAHNRTWLLSLMKQQVYRDGIPAGAAAATKGTVVADKVGWLADTNNDAGIVTLPNGQRYVLVIMTHGNGQSGFSGFPRMGQITKHIQKLVYNPKLVKQLE
ncbi:MAG: class A beta-lactamase-related serine hydrolase [Levilactobacillus sp.]|uniref:serine hydrolase n=1 Tax=Levilactobacillus sp. TaxID=2767919 RepID=UPI00258A4BD0|nr:serine hydrolase [Levilactobacillus sp.]MCI1553130.1 class A beta-lactamase-related serine hydrolase [Levilactobacillus sp.]MCI1598785.1 class A beta-lactamase-related serine hydrolase [Levilactobacillus sp.]MCI1605173.1 class A beta-lactamase-related serine hydrolase [Levilactobacillus sp.]